MNERLFCSWSPQQRDPVAVGPYFPTHVVQFPRGRKVEYPEEPTILEKVLTHTFFSNAAGSTIYSCYADIFALYILNSATYTLCFIGISDTKKTDNITCEIIHHNFTC